VFDYYLLFLPPNAGQNTGMTLASLATIHWYVSITGTYVAANNPPWTYSAYPNLPITGANDPIQTSFLPTWMTANQF
jgi:hypothetical protein